MLAENTESIYRYPPLDLLCSSHSSANISEKIRLQANEIVDALNNVGIEVELENVYCGATITRYDVHPKSGTMPVKIKENLALYLEAPHIRVVPLKTTIGIEIPNDKGETVTLRDVLSSCEFNKAKSELTVAIGKDVKGNCILGNIAQMPNIIISGGPGSGKSACICSMIMSLLFNTSPDEVKLIIIDPTKAEFNQFRTIPHLMKPIITDLNESAKVFKEVICEIEYRYHTFSVAGVKNLNSYNELFKNNKRANMIPRIVVFIDELASIMLEEGKVAEDDICHIARMGHIVGVHLVVATMRQTTDVITRSLKKYIPSRIALSVKSQIDSQILINEEGAECLYHNGDMLYKPQEYAEPVRVQGCYTSVKDIAATVAYITELR